MTAEQFQTLVLVAAAVQVVLLVTIWGCVTGLRSFLHDLDQQNTRIFDRISDIREYLGDIKSELSEIKRTNIARDKMMRAAAGVEVNVK